MRLLPTRQDGVENRDKVYTAWAAVFREQVMEKEQHTVHCKTAEILEFYTLQNSWMASDAWENE